MASKKTVDLTNTKSDKPDYSNYYGPAECDSCGEEIIIPAPDTAEDLHSCSKGELVDAMAYFRMSLLRSGARRSSAISTVLLRMEWADPTDPQRKEILDAIDRYYGSLENFKEQAKDSFAWGEFRKEARKSRRVLMSIRQDTGTVRVREGSRSNETGQEGWMGMVELTEHGPVPDWMKEESK